MSSEPVELILTDMSVFLNKKCFICNRPVEKPGETIIL
jgi:hypothetical protein